MINNAGCGEDGLYSISDTDTAGFFSLFSVFGKYVGVAGNKHCQPEMSVWNILVLSTEFSGFF